MFHVNLPGCIFPRLFQPTHRCWTTPQPRNLYQSRFFLGPGFRILQVGLKMRKTQRIFIQQSTGGDLSFRYPQCLEQKPPPQRDVPPNSLRHNLLFQGKSDVWSGWLNSRQPTPPPQKKSGFNKALLRYERGVLGWAAINDGLPNGFSEAMVVFPIIFGEGIPRMSRHFPTARQNTPKLLWSKLP